MVPEARALELADLLCEPLGAGEPERQRDGVPAIRVDERGDDHRAADSGHEAKLRGGRRPRDGGAAPAREHAKGEAAGHEGTERARRHDDARMDVRPHDGQRHQGVERAASPAQRVGVERVERRRDEQHQRDVRSLDEAVAHRDQGGEDDRGGHHGTQRLMLLAVRWRENRRAPEQPRDGGQQQGLEPDHRRHASRHVRRVEDHAPQPLGVVVRHRGARVRERLVRRQSRGGDQGTSVGQVGPDVGIGDVAEAEQEAGGHHDGPA